jgi:hypothetical protein
MVTTVLLVAALGLAGCTASGSSTRSESGSPSAVQAPTPATGSKGAATGSTDTAAGSASKSTVADPTRDVVSTGTISLTVDNPSTATDEAVRIVQTVGGHVDGREERPRTANDPGSATLVLRIPSTKLDATLERLKKLGREEHASISAQDVTSQSQDLDARITALRTSVDRLLDLMSRATSTTDLIAIESVLSDRQQNLESLEAQKSALTDQVQFATITLELGSPATAPAHVPGTFLSGLLAGWTAFVGFLSGALVVVGVALPWVAFLALLGGIAWFIVRARRTRRA